MAPADPVPENALFGNQKLTYGASCAELLPRRSTKCDKGKKIVVKVWDLFIIFV